MFRPDNKTKQAFIERVKQYKYTLVVEGLIGAGKTTLIEIWEDLLKHVIKVMPECVDPRLLDALYAHPKEITAMFEVLMLLNRFYALTNPLPEGLKCVMDRGLLGVLAFVQLSYLSGRMDAHQKKFVEDAIDALLKQGQVELPDQHVLYVYTSPERCLKNIATRGRECEKAVDLKTLETLESVYFDQIKNFDHGAGKKLSVAYWDDVTPGACFDYTSCPMTRVVYGSGDGPGNKKGTVQQVLSEISQGKCSFNTLVDQDYTPEFAKACFWILSHTDLFLVKTV